MVGSFYNRKIDALMPIEAGGVNSMLPFAAAARLGLPLVDADGMGRAFPELQMVTFTIGGVRTNFRMPDVISIGLGGGSIVREKNGEVTVGPDSVGYRLTEKALVFGGDTLTATDIAVRLGLADTGDPAKAAGIDQGLAEKALARIVEMVEDHLDSMKSSGDAVDVVLVGGGSILLPDHIAGAKKLYKPDHFAVANAIGSAISKVSGAYEKLISYDETPPGKGPGNGQGRGYRISGPGGRPPGNC